MPSQAPVQGQRENLFLSTGTSEMLTRSVNFPKFVATLIRLMWNLCRQAGSTEADGEVRWAACSPVNRD
jgi:hypothetical protein